MSLAIETTEHSVSTLVVGLGLSGLSCARFLAARGEPVAVTDSRVSPPGLDEIRNEFPDVPVFVGGFNSDAFAAADRLVVSPGVSLRDPLIQEAAARGVEITGDIALFAHFAQAPIVAISGSNGKSTVTTLLGEMAKRSGLKALIGGNIGIPALDLLDVDDAELYVLELSSFQLETVSELNAKAAVVLNVSEDHMDRYHSYKEYAGAKEAVFNGDGVIVINRDDPMVVAMSREGRNTIQFGMGVPEANDYGLIEVDGEEYLARGDERLMPVSEICMVGRHNIANALAALALGEAVGISMTAMLETLRNFGGLPHRCQHVATIEGVSWFNDSKGTNVGSTVAAIEGLSQPLVLIAGGQGKGADFSHLVEAVAGKVKAAVLIGEDADKLEQALSAEVSCHRASSMLDAVEKAQKLAVAGDAVLLSPACASFDMFKGFEDRGNQFMDAVQRLKP